MTIIFSVVGLLAFCRGRMWVGRGGRPRVVEGPGVRLAGLLMLILDVLPLFLVAPLWLGFSHGLSTVGITAMFCCFILNILLYGFCSLFGHPAGH